MVLAALSWAVFAVLSTLVMRLFVRLSASSPEAIAYGVTYGRIVCIAVSAPSSRVSGRRCIRRAADMHRAAAELQLCGAEVRALPRDGT